jgi:hypothetical protein
VRSAHRKVMPHVIQSELKTYYIRSWLLMIQVSSYNNLIDEGEP